MSQALEDPLSQRGTTPTDISDDECFELLSNPRRRYVLHYLQNNGGHATLGELAEQIAAWENEIDIGEVSADQRKRVYTSLQQVHLSRMEKMGVVEYDDRAGVVEPGPTAEDLEVYLEVVRGRGIPWSQFYIGLAVVNSAILAAVELDVAPLTVIPDISWAVFTTMSFLIAAVCHYYIGRREMPLENDDLPPEVDA